MKLVLIACNEALDENVIEIFNARGVEGWTRWTKAYGKGKSSGPHLGTHVWPKANNVLLAVTDADTASKLMEDIREMRKRLAKEGIKAFIVPCEDMT